MPFPTSVKRYSSSSSKKIPASRLEAPPPTRLSLSRGKLCRLQERISAARKVASGRREGGDDRTRKHVRAISRRRWRINAPAASVRFVFPPAGDGARSVIEHVETILTLPSSSLGSRATQKSAHPLE